MRGPAYGRLCRQTVTVYRLVRSGAQRAVERVVYPECAFLEAGRHWPMRGEGPRDAAGFLLVLCAPEGALRRGDRVLAGEGPELEAEGWERFVPAEVDGLVVVGRVEAKRDLQGMVCHLEAGQA